MYLIVIFLAKHKNNSYIHISIVSASEKFIMSCKERLKELNILCTINKRTNHTILRNKEYNTIMYNLLIYPQKEVFKFYNFIYQDVSDLMLSNKKKQKFDKFIELKWEKE